MVKYCIQNVNNYLEWVDLGLPSGIKWATCNIGAKTPEEYGEYFSWGETETKECYSLDKYSYRHEDEEGKGTYEIKNDISGNVKYDVACARFGEIARMPTFEEFRELMANCIRTSIVLNGVKGLLFTSNKNANSIFLPSAGYREQYSCHKKYNRGYYWSSTPHKNFKRHAHNMSFNDIGVMSKSYINRYYGLTIRPVSDKI